MAKRTQKKDFTTEQLLQAIEGSNGNMSEIAGRLNCSWATARRYVSFDREAREQYEGENEKMLDKAERIINDSLDSPESNERLQTAKWLLAIKGKARGYNGGSGNVLLSKPVNWAIEDYFS